MTDSVVRGAMDVDLGIRTAGPYSRGAAFMIDLFIAGMAAFLVVVVGGVAYYVAADLGTDPSVLIPFFAGLFLFTTLLIASLLAIMNMVFGAGSSPGKKFLGLQVTYTDGTPISAGLSGLRGATSYFEATFTVGIGPLLSMLASPKQQRIFDRAFDTMVVALPDEVPAVVWPPAFPGDLASIVSEYFAAEPTLRTQDKREVAQELVNLLMARVPSVLAPGNDPILRLRETFFPQ